ncbi:hypothetical protein [Stappia sp. MMSF_3263]|uniref:hypothetical protein n=1 Tax=Stappia sp. MMSF_3263 TaxID=3046693 RepID=UPI00273DA211|nr:hypothetical protein [Stappia sp. MMSF_3263]
MENEGAPQARRPAGRLDGPAARILALAIAAALASAIAWIGQVGFAGVAMTPFANSLAGSGGNAAANPALAACLAERVGAVDQMRADKVINSGQYEAFRARAESYCQTQFPPQ